MTKTSPAAQLARMRKQETKPCAVCGETHTKRKPWMYCSNKCRQKAHYRRYR